jgi:murein peptide amidase A
MLRRMREPVAMTLLMLAACALPPEPQPPAASVAGPEPLVAWKEIGVSVKGRPLLAAKVGRGPRRVLWVGGIHGDEREGEVATEELPEAFLDEPGAAERVTLHILEDANPDGSAMKVRGNANGVDLNRNYPSQNFKADRRNGGRPLSQPEARALHDLILSIEPHLVIVAHAWRGDHFINFDGPGEELAELFSKHSGFPVRTSESIGPTPGSLGSWAGKDLGIPILTLEYRRGRNPDEAWRETRSAILAVITGT